MNLRFFSALIAALISLAVYISSDSNIRGLRFIFNSYFFPSLTGITEHPEQLFSKEYLREAFREEAVLTNESLRDAAGIVRSLATGETFRMGASLLRITADDHWLFQMASWPHRQEHSATLVLNLKEELDSCRQSRETEPDQFFVPSSCLLLGDRDIKIDVCPIVQTLGRAVLSDCRGYL
ncbi:MAG: hypothetical protein H6618_06690 [Deltaproteobacteria bacterium]|nr:hypothetical protein [Deltaproteobacteria bacterium]